MKDVVSLSDTELRDELKLYGISGGPVTGTTRTVYEKKLAKLRAAGPPAKSTPSKPAAAPAVKRTASKSPARAPPVIQKPRKKVTKSESEDESDQEVILSPPSRANTSTRGSKPVTSTPTEVSRTPSPIVPSITRSDSSSRRSMNASIRPANDIIPGLRTGLPPVSASVDKPVSRFGDGDRPGTTPPRKAMHSRVTPPRSSVARIPQSASTLHTSKGYSPRRDLLDLGNTTGEDSDGDGSGLETSRIVYNSYTEGKERRSPLRKAWDRLLGYDFKPGNEPGTSYEMRHGSTRTKVERDPKTGRVRVQQQSVGKDISTILAIVLVVFLSLLTIAYVSTARPEAVMGSLSVLTESMKDTAKFFYNYAILPTFAVAIGALVIVAIYFATRYYKNEKAKEQEQFENLVEKIIDAIRDSAAEGDEFISVPHVRDVMFPPAKRRPAEMARWERAVEFINDNESRVATETRVLRGQECAIWRWLPAKKTGWQGNAFTSPGSPIPEGSNSIPVNALTRCLKIREVFEDREDKDEDDPIDYPALERALREKVYPVRPLHVSFEKNSKEGVVFMKLSTLEDSKNSFTALHGAWFNGHLVSVKYMRDRRYSERFPATAIL